MTLQDQGFRFVRRGSRWDWIHPLDMQAGDEDCTDMDDAQLEANVLAHQFPGDKQPA